MFLSKIIRCEFKWANVDLDWPCSGVLEIQNYVSSGDYFSESVLDLFRHDAT